MIRSEFDLRLNLQEILSLYESIVDVDEEGGGNVVIHVD